jgi:hypothetical protein
MTHARTITSDLLATFMNIPQTCLLRDIRTSNLQDYSSQFTLASYHQGSSWKMAPNFQLEVQVLLMSGCLVLLVEIFSSSIVVLCLVCRATPVKVPLNLLVVVLD